jgi:hypothetical protein
VSSARRRITADLAEPPRLARCDDLVLAEVIIDHAATVRSDTWTRLMVAVHIQDLASTAGCRGCVSVLHQSSEHPRQVELRELGVRFTPAGWPAPSRNRAVALNWAIGLIGSFYLTVRDRLTARL